MIGKYGDFFTYKKKEETDSTTEYHKCILLKNLAIWKKGQRLDEIIINHEEPYGMMFIKGEIVCTIDKQI